MLKTRLFIVVLLIALLAGCSPVAPGVGPLPKITLATTTSTQDSGLLDVIIPIFEAETGVKVDVIAVGTGQALALGVDGNADVLLVHARSQEDAFMAAGDGVRREDVMYNDFVILGPADDPAGVQGSATAVEAFTKIADAQVAFVSRGDNSGHEYQGKGRVGRRRDRADWGLVCLRRPGHGRCVDHGRRAHGLYPERPGHLLGPHLGGHGTGHRCRRRPHPVQPLRRHRRQPGQKRQNSQ